MDPFILPDKEKLLSMTNKNQYFKLKNFITEHTNLIPQKMRVIDLGCGEGINTIALSHHFKIVYGVDPSSKMLKSARANKKLVSKFGKNIGNVRFYNGDFESIPINNVEMIFMKNSIHFSESVSKTLDNVLAHLRLGGIVVIMEPHNKSVFSFSKNSKMHQNKLKKLEKTRNIIKKYTSKSKILSILLEKETPKRFSIVFQKKEK